MTAVNHGMLAAADELAAAAGDDVSKVRESIREQRATDDMIRRVLIVAERRHQGDRPASRQGHRNAQP